MVASQATAVAVALTADHCCAYQVAAVVAVKLQKYRADEEAVLLDPHLDVALDPSDRILVNLPILGRGTEGTALAGGVEASGCKGSRGTTRSPEVFMIK